MRVDPVAIVGDMEIHAGSRTRLIMPGKTTDNYGFAGWVKDNAEELVKLGPGRHFGEWYGQGIQRTYGLKEKRFMLFNTERWAAPSRYPFHPWLEEDAGKPVPPQCCETAPVLYRGEFDTAKINAVLTNLGACGSQAVPGFMDPEGIVVYHTHARVAFKKTFDDKHKEAA